MIKKTKVDPSEIEAFYQAMQGVKPLNPNKKVPLKAPSKEQPKDRKPTKRESIQLKDEELNSSQNGLINNVGSEETLSYKQNSISHKSLRKLRKGQYNIDAVLDLHGMSVDEAKMSVEKSIEKNLQTGSRLILIIHGKGRKHESPILKNKLNRWLRTTPYVLAFCSATQEYGGRGALFVLLKRGSEESSIE